MAGTTDRPDQPDERPDPEGRGDRDQTEQERTDAAWAKIVAELSDLSTDPQADRTADHSPEAVAFDFPVAPWVADPAASASAHTVAGSGPRDWPGVDGGAGPELDGQFVAPDPPMELSKDPLRNLAALALCASPLAIALVAIFWTSAPRGVYTSLLGLFLVGVGLMIWRLPRGRDGDSGRQGAVV